MHRAVKSLVCVKNILKAHNFFRTKATDLKNYIFEKPLKNWCRNMRHTLIFVLNQKNICLFVFFSTLPSTQTIKVIDLIFFQWAGLENWALNMHFNPIPILQGPPILYIDSEPPAFIGLNHPVIIFDFGDKWNWKSNYLRNNQWKKGKFFWS